MPQAAQSPVRRRVTDVVRLIECTGIDVAHAGDQCALMLYTRQGIVRATMPLHVFLEKARGPKDCNGHAFPRTSLGRREAIERELAQDATIPPRIPAAERIPDDSPVAHAAALLNAQIDASDDGVAPLGVKPPTPTFLKAAAAFNDLKQFPNLAVQKAAEIHGIPQSTLCAWLSLHRREEWRQIRAARRAAA